MRGSLTVVLLVSTLALVLACGGEWDAAMAQAVGDQIDEMTGKVVGCADSPEKDRLLTALAGAKAAAGNVGMVEVATLQVEVEEAASDGSISAAEADALVAKVSEVTASK
jgi:hypothetical protein